MATGGEPNAPSGAETAIDPVQALAELDAIRRRVVNVVGHVLRTPVTTIAGMAAALQVAPDDDTRDRLVLGLARNARRLEELLDDLLIAAGVSTALPVDELASIPVAPVLANAWTETGGPGELEVEGSPQRVSVRPRSLQRIAEILFDNALKYGHGPVAARIGTTSTGIRIEIESAGDGPSDEELTHAFELLYRGEHAVMSGPGLGLGLSVARELARADGGDVTLERRAGGLVALVDLPG